MTNDNERPSRPPDPFIQRLMAVAPELTEEEVESIRRLADGEMPTDGPL
jgi:hypothetical protein